MWFRGYLVAPLGYPAAHKRVPPCEALLQFFVSFFLPLFILSFSHFFFSLSSYDLGYITLGGPIGSSHTHSWSMLTWTPSWRPTHQNGLCCVGGPHWSRHTQGWCLLSWCFLDGLCCLAASVGDLCCHVEPFGAPLNLAMPWAFRLNPRRFV